MRPFALTVAIALASLAALAGEASAYSFRGDPWPGDEIAFYVQSAEHKKAVSRGARAWNEREVGIRFRKVLDPDDANVVVRKGETNCGGSVPPGYRGKGIVVIMRLAPGCGTNLMTLAAVHELGHVLGLGHERQRCARMNPTYDQTGTPGDCSRHSLSYWLEHPLAKDDVRGARALYD